MKGATPISFYTTLAFFKKFNLARASPKISPIFTNYPKTAGRKARDSYI
jgi:hypothetical protein